MTTFHDENNFDEIYDNNFKSGSGGISEMIRSL